MDGYDEALVKVTRFQFDLVALKLLAVSGLRSSQDGSVFDDLQAEVSCSSPG